MRPKTFALFIHLAAGATLFAGEPDIYKPVTHPPLPDLIKEADLIALTSGGVRHKVVVYHIDKVLKGAYVPGDFQGMYKGTYTHFLRDRDTPSVPEQALIIVKFPGKVKSGDDDLILPISKDTVAYPSVTQRGQVLSYKFYTIEDIQKLVSGR